MSSLTEAQSFALDRYEELQATYPRLFGHRELRPLVLDRNRLEEYGSEYKVVLGVAVETSYFLFVCDLVQPRGVGDPYVYSRLINVGQLKGGTNIAILATIANAELGRLGDIVLVQQERHATGLMETAIPRGFAEPGLDGVSNALRELREETGYIGSGAEFLGETVTDSGAGDARVSFYHVRVDSKVRADPEPTEAIRSVHLVSPEDLMESVGSGKCADSFTLQALALSGLIPVSGS